MKTFLLQLCDLPAGFVKRIGCVSYYARPHQGGALSKAGVRASVRVFVLSVPCP